MNNDQSTPPTEPTLRLSNLHPRTKKMLGGVLAFGLILVGALFIYATLVGPSKQPYRDAYTQYKNVYNANVAFTNSGAALNAGAASDEEFGRNISTIRSAMNSLKAENEALSKADVLKEGEGKVLYDTFDKKLQQYLAYNEGIIASIGTLRPVLFNCSSKMSNIEAGQVGAGEVRACAQAMGEMKDLPDADYAQLAEKFESLYYEIAENIEAVAALADPKGVDAAVQATLIEDRNYLLEQLSGAGDALSKNLQASRDKVDITTEAMALDEYLDRESSVF